MQQLIEQTTLQNLKTWFKQSFGTELNDIPSPKTAPSYNHKGETGKPVATTATIAIN